MRFLVALRTSPQPNYLARFKQKEKSGKEGKGGSTLEIFYSVGSNVTGCKKRPISRTPFN